MALNSHGSNALVVLGHQACLRLSQYCGELPWLWYIKPLPTNHTLIYLNSSWMNLTNPPKRRNGDLIYTLKANPENEWAFLRTVLGYVLTMNVMWMSWKSLPPLRLQATLTLTPPGAEADSEPVAQHAPCVWPPAACISLSAESFSFGTGWRFCVK